MGFESQGNNISPGGFEFGCTGWVWGPPVPKSITFYLDGSCSVCDQYGRHIRCAQLNSGEQIMFADRPPDSPQDGVIVPRPQFASHAQTIAALYAERIDWLAWEVRFRTTGGKDNVRGGLTMEAASKLQEQLLREGKTQVMVTQTIACAGWPQLPYEELKKLKVVPPTPAEELRKINDAVLRRDALRYRREVDEMRVRDRQEDLPEEVATAK